MISYINKNVYFGCSSPHKIESTCATYELTPFVINTKTINQEKKQIKRNNKKTEQKS